MTKNPKTFLDWLINVAIAVPITIVAALALGGGVMLFFWLLVFVAPIVGLVGVIHAWCQGNPNSHGGTGVSARRLGEVTARNLQAENPSEDSCSEEEGIKKALENMEKVNKAAK